jgi:glutamine amidotransferase
MGNRRSVQKALEHIGASASITHDPELIASADGLVVPGVGAFPLAMRNLAQLGLIELLHERAGAGVPLLGICLGMQLLFERSSELEPVEGLGLLRGDVTPLATGGLRVPHIGWNEVSFKQPCTLTEGLGGGRAFYHVHSLAARPTDPDDVVGTAEYGERFAAMVARRNVFGLQFHPEKSSSDGLALLANFTRLCVATSVTARAVTARA